MDLWLALQHCGRLSVHRAALAYAVKLNMAGLSNIDAYMARMAERPAVAAALKAEGLN